MPDDDQQAALAVAAHWLVRELDLASTRTSSTVPRAGERPLACSAQAVQPSHGLSPAANQHATSCGHGRSRSCDHSVTMEALQSRQYML